VFEIHPGDAASWRLIMKAVVTNPYVMGYLELGEAVNPVANSDEAVISVKTYSFNRNELRRDEAAEAGTRI